MAEREKRRSTTFRTSRGAIVNVAAPLIYVASSITRNDVLEALDVHSTFQWERFLEEGIDRHFIGREVLLDGTEQNTSSSLFWKQVDYGALGTFDGSFTLPKNRRAVCVYSRRAFDYPEVMEWVKLPNLVRLGNETDVRYYSGVEAGSGYGNGIATFRLYTDATVSNRLEVIVGPDYSSRILVIDVNKPVDYLTVPHRYRILHSRNLSMFTIDNAPVAFGVPVGGDAISVKSNVLPYSIALTGPMPKSITAFKELGATDRSQEAPSDLVAPITPFAFRIQDGHETIPLRLPLYEEDTSNYFIGKLVTAGTLTSHPFPIFGYVGKTICFRANQSSTANGLIIEYWTRAGNWRTFDAVTYTANENWFRTPTGEGILARLSYTPAAYPAAVAEGEVALR